VSLDERLEAFRQVFPRACLKKDGPVKFIYIPELPVEVVEKTYVLDALLCPEHHSGYSTRLFLSERISERQSSIKGNAANWTTHGILGRQWHSWSWQNVAADQSLFSMLANHLAALR
jgi:hypothetical protein